MQGSDGGREEERKNSACLDLLEIFYYEQLTKGKRGFSFVCSQQSMLTTNMQTCYIILYQVQQRECAEFHVRFS